MTKKTIAIVNSLLYSCTGNAVSATVSKPYNKVKSKNRWVIRSGLGWMEDIKWPVGRAYVRNREKLFWFDQDRAVMGNGVVKRCRYRVILCFVLKLSIRILLLLFLLLLQLFYYLASSPAVHFRPGFVNTILRILTGVSIVVGNNQGPAETLGKKSCKK